MVKMMKNIVLTLICLISIQFKSQSVQQLKNDLQQIISNKNATFGISVKGIEDKDTLSINGNRRMPMMSVFKFHIALAVLDQVDKGKLQLNQNFSLKKKSFTLIPGAQSETSFLKGIWI